MTAPGLMYASSIPVSERVTAGSEPSGQVNWTLAAVAVAVATADGGGAESAGLVAGRRSRDGLAVPAQAPTSVKISMAAIAVRRNVRLARTGWISLLQSTTDP